MWKMVLSDMRYGIKPGLKKVFKQFINYYIYLYLMFLAPVILHLSGKYVLFYYSAILPMIFSMLLFTMYGEGVNKTLYLCPLSREDRRQYFLISWGIRAGLPSLSSLLFESVLCICGWISPITALLVVSSIVFFSSALGLYRNTQEISRQDSRLAHHGAWSAAVLLLGLFDIIFLAAIVGDVEEPRFTVGEVVLTLVLFFAHALTALTVILKYFRPVMEGLVCYEKVKCGKVENMGKGSGN